jgi:hypothetical protein
MHNALFSKEPAPTGWNIPGDLSEKRLDGLRSYQFDIGSVAHYDQRVQEEIARGITDISKVMSPNRSKLRITVPFTSARSGSSGNCRSAVPYSPPSTANWSCRVKRLSRVFGAAWRKARITREKTRRATE